VWDVLLPYKSLLYNIVKEPLLTRNFSDYRTDLSWFRNSSNKVLNPIFPILLLPIPPIIPNVATIIAIRSEMSTPFCFLVTEGEDLFNCQSRGYVS
jgi:hypothetical protein